MEKRNEGCTGVQRYEVALWVDAHDDGSMQGHGMMYLLVREAVLVLMPVYVQIEDLG